MSVPGQFCGTENPLGSGQIGPTVAAKFKRPNQGYRKGFNNVHVEVTNFSLWKSGLTQAVEESF